MPNLMPILSIFLKLKAVKQSGLGFLAYLVYIAPAELGIDTGVGRKEDYGATRWSKKF